MKTITKPWGKEELLELNDKYCYKRIYFNAGHQCSLQYHEYKKETIYVVSGEGYIHLELTPKNGSKYSCNHTTSWRLKEAYKGNLIVETIKLQIKAGDLLTSSTTNPGYATKATETNNVIIGRALENWTKESTTLLALVGINWNDNQMVRDAVATTPSLELGIEGLNVGIGKSRNKFKHRRKRYRGP